MADKDTKKSEKGKRELKGKHRFWLGPVKWFLNRQGQGKLGRKIALKSGYYKTKKGVHIPLEHLGRAEWGRISPKQVLKQRNEDLDKIEEKWGSLDGDKGLRQQIIDITNKLGPYTDFGLASYNKDLPETQEDKDETVSGSIINAERGFLAKGTGVEEYTMLLFENSYHEKGRVYSAKEEEGKMITKYEELENDKNVYVKVRLPKTIPLLFPEGRVIMMNAMGFRKDNRWKDIMTANIEVMKIAAKAHWEYQIESIIQKKENIQDFNDKVQKATQDLQKMKDDNSIKEEEYRLRLLNSGYPIPVVEVVLGIESLYAEGTANPQSIKQKIENNFESIKDMMSDFAEDSIHGKRSDDPEKNLKQVNLKNFEMFWRSFLGAHGKEEKGEMGVAEKDSMMALQETLMIKENQLNLTRPDMGKAQQEQGQVILPKDQQRTFKVIRPEVYELYAEGKERKIRIHKLKEGTHGMPGNFWIRKQRGEYRPGCDGNGMPLEVDDDGYVLIDRMRGESVIRKVPKMHIRKLPLYEKATYIHNLWDSYRDDLRDSRYHPRSITAIEYAMAADDYYRWEWYLPKKDESGDVTHERMYRPRPWKIDVNEDTRHRKIRKYSDVGVWSGEVDEGDRVPDAMSPAFDFRGLKKSWQHAGRVYYYDKPDDILTQRPDIENNLWQHIEPGFCSTRGTLMFNKDYLQRMSNKYSEYLEALREMTKETGADYGIRNQGSKEKPDQKVRVRKDIDGPTAKSTDLNANRYNK